MGFAVRLRKEHWGRKVYRVLEKLYFTFMFFLKKKYYIEMENCGSFKSFGFIYIYIYTYIINNLKIFLRYLTINK